MFKLESLVTAMSSRPLMLNSAKTAFPKVTFSAR